MSDIDPKPTDEELKALLERILPIEVYAIRWDQPAGAVRVKVRNWLMGSNAGLTVFIEDPHHPVPTDKDGLHEG